MITDIYTDNLPVTYRGRLRAMFRARGHSQSQYCSATNLQIISPGTNRKISTPDSRQKKIIHLKRVEILLKFTMISSPCFYLLENNALNGKYYLANDLAQWALTRPLFIQKKKNQA